MRSIHCPHCAGTIELLGTAEAAEQLNVAPSHVRRLAEAGKVQATKIGRDWLFVAPVEEPAPGQRGNPNQCDRCGKFASHLWGVYGEGEWCDTCIEEAEEEMEAGSDRHSHRRKEKKVAPTLDNLHITKEEDGYYFCFAGTKDGLYSESPDIGPFDSAEEAHESAEAWLRDAEATDAVEELER